MWRNTQCFFFITALFLHGQPLVSVCCVFGQQHAFKCSHLDVKDANQHNRLLTAVWSCIDLCVCVRVFTFGEGGWVEKNRWTWSPQSPSHHVLSLNMQLPAEKHTHLIFGGGTRSTLWGTKSSVINLQDICSTPSLFLLLPSPPRDIFFYLRIPFIIVHLVNLLLTLSHNQ